ncbi:MAG: hypothetical protein GY832_34045 [Chloroflexi bacterium]|nr:hypothetical protein [Chloroflexota bacterium]
MVIDDWYPVTCNFGLINTTAEQVVAGLQIWHNKIGIRYERGDITSSLEDAFESLLPLSVSMMRRLYISTHSEWTACFQNGIQGSDPFPAMSMLARQLKVLAMRVCSTRPNVLYPANIWEVYAPPELGGSEPLGYRRTIECMNDGGPWVFDTSGEVFPFENVDSYKARRKRDRFTRELFAEYLEQFGVNPFADSFYSVSTSTPAILLQQVTHVWEAKEYTLEEVVAGKPWSGKNGVDL